MKRYKKPNRIVQIVFFLLRNNWISILFGLLFIIFAFFLLTFSEKTNLETKAWYSSNWQYRRDVEVENDSGLGRSDEDVLVIVDTSSLITAGKMQSSCNDIRFVDSDDSTLLSYWIEDGCNTTSTQIWVRIPLLPVGGKTIYLYYGNAGASSASMVWNGNVVMFADTTCPSGWTRVSAMDDKFLYGSATYGSTGGIDNHGHENVSVTSTSISTTSLGGNTAGTNTGTTTTHTHTSLQASIGSVSSLPPYINMIMCSKKSFIIDTGLISMFSTAAPTGWTRFSALDDRMPRAASSYGATGGATTHNNHSVAGVSTTSSPSGTQGSHTGSSATGGTVTTSGSYKIHTFTSSGTFTPATDMIVDALVVAGGGGGGGDASGGGGAGGVLYSTSYSLSSGAKAITVGAGGAANQNGQNSSIGNLLVAIGGGAGRKYLKGNNGGSGGGGSYLRGTGEFEAGLGTSGQGNNGGVGRYYYRGGGGGGAGAAGANASAGGHGGIGVANSITGTSVYYGGGGGGGATAMAAGTGGTGGGGNGSPGTPNTGGGGGGGGGSASTIGGSGGSGIVIIRYIPMSATATVASGTHTHTNTNATLNQSTTNVPPYQDIVFAKANGNNYIDSSNILVVSELPPLGWTRFVDLDNRFPRGATTFGATGGASTHTHTGTITTGGPSASITSYGTGANYASDSHTHSASFTTDAVSNIPPYYSVIYTQRKTSFSTVLSTVEQYVFTAAPSAPLNLVATYGDGQVTLGWSKPSDEGGGVTDYIVQYSNDGGSTWNTFNDGTSSNRYTTVTGLTNGNLYTFRVAAVNPAGTGAYSNTVQSTPQALVITSISPTSGLYLGGGSMTINATGLGDTQKFTQVSAGASHTCGLGGDGQGYCWGYNNYGQLGNGYNGLGANSNVPVLVSQGARNPGVIFSSISAGGNHTCAIGSDGEGYCWGYNVQGQLGNGTSGYGVDSNSPVLVSQGARDPGVTFISISAGSSHTCAIGSDGEGYCWGSGSNGRLGNGGTAQSTIPVLVSQGARPSGVTFSSISAGIWHTCGIGSDGNGYCWGRNYSGGLGNGGTAQRTTPVLVSQGARPSGVTFSSISVGYSHTCGVGSNGEGYCWGYNYYGQLGNGNTGTNSNVPVLVSQGVRPANVTFSSISAGNNHTCGVGSDGNGYCWGRNNSGQLGNGNTGTNSNTPVLVSQGVRPSGVTFTSISAGDYHACGLGSDGSGYCWGENQYGRLGNDSTTNSNVPVLSSGYQYQIAIGNNILTQYVSGGLTSITVNPIPAHVVGTASVSLKRVYDNKQSNSVSYTYNNLATPDITSITPSTVSPNTSNTFSLTGTNFLDYGPIDNLTSISTGIEHTCGIDGNGNGYCWGNGSSGRLGNGGTGDSNIPVLVSQGARPSGVTFTSISAGSGHTCGVGSDGNGYCWGSNECGQLGNGNTGTDSNIPVLVSQGARPSGVTFSSISAGIWHTCGIGSDGNGYCWGSNNYGQLGNGGSGTDADTPVLVSQGARDPGVTFSSVSVGQYHTCALGSDGNGYCWGSNECGQLGNGNTGTDSNIPVLVSQGARDSGVTFSSVSVGQYHTCALGSDGNGYCWGENQYGRLGNGGTDGSTTPVLVSQGARDSGVTFNSISAGSYHACAVGSDGNGYCWGYNNHGQLGNGSSGSGADSNIPVLVSQGAVPVGVTFTSISAGVWHTCGRLSNNRTLCWGNNQSGQLGNRETVNRPTPSYVLIVKSPTIEFGSTPATSTTYTSTTAMSAVSPTLSAGTIPVKLTNPDGQYDIYNIFAGSIPSAPLNLVATYGDGQVVLGWSKPADEGGEVTDYIVQYSNDGGSTWNTFNDGTSSNRYTTVTGLTNGNLYTFRVAAVNPAGTGAYSNTVQSTPQALVITSISPTSGLYLGGGSMTINATGLGDSQKFAQVSAGTNHTCGLSHDGQGYCWGYNNSGQLGNGSTTNSNIPVLVSQGAMGSSVTFSSISAGANHTCGVGSDGEGYCWGSNYSGELGNGNTGTDSNIPVLVSDGAMGSSITFSSISAGVNHTCGVGSDGHGYCWGYNYYGQLGNGYNGSGTDSNVPVLVSQGARDPGVTFISISAGNGHTCGVGSDGNGYCWGYNQYGQLGNGNTGTNSNVPVLVSQGARDPGVTFISISTGLEHTCGIGSDGEGYCWGRNNTGQLGNGYTVNSNVPVLVSQGARPSGVTFSSISAGGSHTCAIGSDGNGYCWGYNYSGQLGNNYVTYSFTPFLVSQGARPSGVIFSSISLGNYHTCAIGSDGNGYCWGGNGYGQFGNGSTTTNSYVPVLSSGYQYQIAIGNNILTQYVPGGSTSITVNLIPAHVVGTASVSLTRIMDNITSNSVSYTYNNLPGPDITSIIPSVISPNGGTSISLAGTNFLDYGPMSTFSSISAGSGHTCAVGSDGNGYCWGNNGSSQLGNGSTTDSNVPVLVSQGARPSGVTFSSISAGDYHACGLGSDGSGYCWGGNEYGQLGNGNTGTDSNVPVLVSQGARPSGVTFSSISAGSSHTCAVGSNGEGYCWGDNGSGQLGNGNTGTGSNVPVLVSQGARPSGVTFSSISAGGSHTCAIGSDGNGYCWGYNYSGQLGNGSTTNSNIPVLVSQGAMGSGVIFSSISAGGNHTCAIGSDGEGYCWGWNNYGQLGNGDGGINPDTPVLVSQGARPSGVTFSSISSGNYHTCAIGSNGEGYCWGTGYIGNGNTYNSNVPVLVSQEARPVGTIFSSISAGDMHTCGVGSDGHGYCWGYNEFGQLGNNETVDRPTLSYVLIVKSPTIEFGSTPATSTTYTSTTAMSAVSPVLSVGTIAVKLTNPDGQYDTYDISVQGPPTVPLNLGATAGNTQVVLTWNVPSSDGGSSITDYIIQYSTDNSTWITFNDGTSTNTTATVTGLTNNTQYYFRVAAVNSIGTGPYTSSVTATPVNVAPTFTNISNTSPVTPGNNITWNTTASDSDGQVKLLVCKTPGITNGTCNGDSWCSSSLVSSNPSCSYSVPNPMVNDTYDAYVYIVDNQNEPATGIVQGTNSSFTVSSVAPIVTNITLNGGNAINLVESDVKSVILTAQVTSDNGCTEITNVKGYLYRSNIQYSGCDTSGEVNHNYCYPEIECSVDVDSNSCEGATDKTADYTCTINVQYFADPTDIGTQYDSQNWLATIKATNSGDLSTSTEVTTGVEMNSLTAFSVTSTLSYSDLLVGESNNPLDRVLTTTATGNVGLDQEHKGEGIGMCTDYPTCEVGTPIALSHQKYSLTASTPYSTPTTAISLTNTSVEVELNLTKPTSTTTVSKNTWWGVFIPPNTLPGYYEGENTITAKKGEVANW
jgi:alpha-tubulin suppressor-like RCC1 family protein